MLLPHDPNAVYFLWFLKWREHIRTAKSCQINDVFCRAAILCNMEYNCHLAIETVKLKKAGIITDGI